MFSFVTLGSNNLEKSKIFYNQLLDIIDITNVEEGNYYIGYAKKTNLEKIEDIELLRALEIGLKIKTIDLKGDSFSIDVYEDFLRAKDKFKSDKIFKKYI